MIKSFKKSNQVYGEFNHGEIIENKPIGFPQDNGQLKPYSNLFYWAHAIAKKDSTIGLHPHRGFEIMTIVLEGKIKHYDTLLSKWIPLDKGDVQLIQSRSGISHAETLLKESRIFQIWFQPDLRKALHKAPNYLDVRKEELPQTDEMTTIVGHEAPFKLDAENIEVSLHHQKNNTYHLQVDANYYYSIYLIEGKLKINQVHFQTDDFFVISQESSINYEVLQESHFLCIKSPINISYPIY